ncbi:MAG: M20/M25/M40 family metallo-hydrolase [Candidatus Solibacter usitatus]|nr:M20/M25/M40 family metallo-hydrolase [Candidatus Solibacter usitatus]
MKRIFLLILAAAVIEAAEPNWPQLEKSALDLLQRYLRIASINPPGDTTAAADLLQGALESHGFQVRRFTAAPGYVNLLTRLPGRDRSRKPLLLMNHMDVVPVDRAAWKMDPFGAVIQDGYVWGRGALDMKGIGIQQILSLIALKEAGIVPARDIVLLITADEEMNGTYGIRWMIANHWKEIDAEYVLDEGGFGTREILAQGKLVFGVMVGEKQSVWLRLRAKGTAAHGSQPIPDNANLILMRAIQRAMELPAAQPHPVVAEMRRNIAAPLAANKYTAAIQANTASLTTLQAGVGSPPKINVIPSNSEATLDCRLLPGVDHREFISELKKRINDPRVSVELASTPNDSGVSSSQTPLFEAIRAAIRKHHPEAVVTPMLVPHGTDSSNLRLKGMIAYGLTPMVLDLATAGTMHSDAERIPVAEFYKGLRIFFDVLKMEY